MSADLDAEFTRIEKLAAGRGLPGMERSTSYGTPALKVGDTAFVRLSEPGTLVLQCPEEQKALLLDLSPDIYFETDHYVGYPTVLVRLAAIDDEELSLRLEDAWRFKAPKALADQKPVQSARD